MAKSGSPEAGLERGPSATQSGAEAPTGPAAEGAAPSDRPAGNGEDSPGWGSKPAMAPLSGTSGGRSQKSGPGATRSNDGTARLAEAARRFLETAPAAASAADDDKGAAVVGRQPKPLKMPGPESPEQRQRSNGPSPGAAPALDSADAERSANGDRDASKRADLRPRSMSAIERTGDEPRPALKLGSAAAEAAPEPTLVAAAGDRMQDTAGPDADGGPVEDTLARCLSFLSKLYGHAYSEEQLRTGIALEKGRLNLEGLVQSAERIGIHVQLDQCRLSQIPKLALPAILMLEDGRACVLVRYTAKTTVEVYDPRVGDATSLVPLSEVEPIFTGEVAYVRPRFRFDTRSEILAPETPRSWFWGSLFQNWWIYGHAILATVIVNILAVASPIFIMTVYDRVVPNNAVETLWVLAVGIASVAVFDFILRTLRGYLVDVAGKRLDVQLGSRLFDRVVRLRMDARTASAGSLASIMREFDFLREFLSSATVTTIGDLPFIFLFIFVIYLIGGPIAYVPMTAVPIVLLISIAIQIPLHRITRQSMKEVTQKNAHLFEVLHGIETIKAIRAETWAQRNWEQLVGLTATSAMKMRMLSQIGTHTTMVAQLLVTAGIVVVGVHVLREGDITQGALIACVLLSSRVMAPLAQVAGVLVRFEQTKTAFSALHEIMNAPVERVPEKKLVHKPHLKGDLEFKEVSFSYPIQDINALNKISFQVEAGEHVAIIGRVGSGKSSVIKLIQNLYEPAEGFVRVDDLDTRQIELADLRRQVGYTPQETVLFHGTIRDNLVQGAPHATDEQVLQAAHLAGLDDMIKQSPKGLDQDVGEHGTLLSGGQRQMIVLARALVLDPPILLLDEPTSHLDNFAERQFINKMQDWLEGRTLVLVTHRATLLALVDRLIVMDKGQIVADGPKEEVLSALAAGKIGAAKT